MKTLKHFVFLRNPPKQLSWGGLEKLVCEWFERIDYQECRVTFIVAMGWKETYDKAFEARHLPIDVIETNLDSSRTFWEKFISMYGLLNKLRPTTCVFLQGHFFCFHFVQILAAWFICRGNVFIHENLGAPRQFVKSSKKYFGFIPGFALWWYAERMQTLFRAYFCKNVLTVSEGVKENLVKLWDYPKEKVLVCYHGIDLMRFLATPQSLTEERRRLGINQEGKIIIVAARLSQEKCVDRVIDAFDDLAALDGALELLILGSGPLENQLKSLAASKKTVSRIKFLGHQENVSDYLKAGDCFVLSSDNEGLGLALLEAMASGLVCLSTRCPGPMEIIQDGVNGYLIEKSSKGVKEGLQKVFSMPISQRQQMTDNAIGFVARKFELNACVKNVFSIIGIPFKEKKLCS